jgi:hypothetical protein
MPVGEIVGEFIAEIVLRPVAAVITHVFGALGYFTGAAFFTIVTFGRLPLAPLDFLFDAGRFDKKRKFGLGLWMDQPGKRRALKAGWVCLAGLLLWIAIGIGFYQVMKGRQARSEASPPAVLDESKPRPSR